MVVRPPSVFRIGPAGVRRRVEVFSGIIRVRMSILPTLPHTVPPLFKVVDGDLGWRLRAVLVAVLLDALSQL